MTARSPKSPGKSEVKRRMSSILRASAANTATGQVREDGSRGVDRILPLEAHEALLAGPLLLHRVEARLPRPGATDSHAGQ
jgi:hypothetical protein